MEKDKIDKVLSLTHEQKKLRAIIDNIRCGANIVVSIPQTVIHIPSTILDEDDVIEKCIKRIKEIDLLLKEL